MNKIQVYTDGACRGNQFKENIGGYGILIMNDGDYREYSAAFKNTTNNRMELLCVIEALKNTKNTSIPVEILSDSQYVVSTINNNWKKNANIDLWTKLGTELKRFTDVTFIKVKGHSDNIYNSRADELANIAMDNYKEDIIF